MLGVHDVFLHDAGAYAPYGLTVGLNSQCTLLGQYDVPNYYTEFKAVFTNKPIVTPYVARVANMGFLSWSGCWTLPPKN